MTPEGDAECRTLCLSLSRARARAQSRERKSRASRLRGAGSGGGCGHIAWTEVYAVVECRSERTRADGCGRASTRKNL